jgi:rod shape-determining protein MreC
MRYLFIFLKKQSFFLLFVILELLAIILLVNNAPYHKTKVINSANVITGSINSTYSFITDYFFLKEANRQLSIENARLRKGIAYMDISDSLYSKDTSYLFIPAKVISNTSRNRNNFIMINKGSKDGIEREMGLISPLGVAGIIVDISSHYATAMSLLHKDTRISAKLKSNGQMVSVGWDGLDYRKGLVEDIPSHIRPMPGDTVITSGYSFVFPENLLIGTIGEKIESTGNLNKAELIFSTDFNQLHFVYITKNLASEELDSLQINMINE